MQYSRATFPSLVVVSRPPCELFHARARLVRTPRHRDRGAATTSPRYPLPTFRSLPLCPPPSADHLAVLLWLPACTPAVRAPARAAEDISDVQPVYKSAQHTRPPSGSCATERAAVTALPPLFLRKDVGALWERYRLVFQVFGVRHSRSAPPHCFVVSADVQILAGSMKGKNNKRDGKPLAGANPSSSRERGSSLRTAAAARQRLHDGGRTTAAARQRPQHSGRTTATERESDRRR